MSFYFPSLGKNEFSTKESQLITHFLNCDLQCVKPKIWQKNWNWQFLNANCVFNRPKNIWNLTTDIFWVNYSFHTIYYLDKYHPANCMQIHHPLHFCLVPQCRSRLADSPSTELASRDPRETSCIEKTRKHYVWSLPRCRVAQAPHRWLRSCEYRTEECGPSIW